jgi:hypothetical protein
VTDIDKRARIAGAIYLAASLPAFFSLAYVPNALIVSGDAGATMARIAASEGLFRWGIAAELTGFAIWTFVPLALYRLLADVDRTLAGLMVVLGLITVPMMFVNALAELSVLTLLGDPRFAAAFPPHQLQALVALALRTHSQGFTVAGIFWGLWLFPFAALVWRSGFLPRFIAVLLTIAGVGWLVASLTALVAPEALAAVRRITSIATKGELVTIFWLLLAGARAARPASPSSAAADGSAPAIP